MDNWQRLEQVIKWTGLSTNAFALGIGLKRSENLYQIKRGSFGISKELARLITEKYPEVNRAWLLTGEGSMLIPTTGDLVSAGITNMQGAVPYFHTDILSLSSGKQSNPTEYLLVPMFEGATFAAYYTGNSMAPSVPNGSTVVVKTTSVEGVLPGEIYLVATEDFVAVRKIRTLPDDNTKFLLVADNREEYDDVSIDKDSISSIYLVMGVILNYQG